MKRVVALFCVLLCCLGILGCTANNTPAQIVATTLPVYEFTQLLCTGTDLKVARLINEDIACLHDYSLQVSQMQILEGAELVLTSGAGLEDFLEDVKEKLPTTIDLSADIPLMHQGEHHHHNHESEDPHYWLSPNNSKIMAKSICTALSEQYPQHKDLFESNLADLNAKLDRLQAYGDSQLADLSSKKLITFHDGFSYMADAFGLEIVHCVSEESGSEASAQELIELSTLIEKYHLLAIFTEKNGSTAAARIVARETGIEIFALDMAMSGDSYFDAMYHNIDAIKEALE